MGIVSRHRIGRITKNTLKQETDKNIRAMMRMSGETRKQLKNAMKEMEDYFFPKRNERWRK